MPRIVAAASAFPSHRVPQVEARDAAGRFFAGNFPGLNRLLPVFDHARVESRRLMRPLPWYFERHPAEEINRIFVQEGGALLAEAAQRCLDAAGCSAQAVDMVIAVTTTGLSTPSLDARLVGALGLRSTVARMPLWGLGCAGGAAGLARAFDFCRAVPGARVLVAGLETCSLTLFPDDISKKNLVATAIFGDGAAAVLVAGDDLPVTGPRILATRSQLFPDTERIMGWDITGGGMELVLSPRLPALIRQQLPGLVDDFLRDHGHSRSELVHFITHPGGAKVIDAYRQALHLSRDDLALTEELLRAFGNISSVSVLAVLERWLASPRAGQHGLGLLSAFGPGFAAELVLLEV